MRSIISIISLFFIFTISTSVHAEGQWRDKPKKTCLVLSVGGTKGLAHIGAIDALKDEGIPIDCVYGNSMGAVIGGLYSTDPSADLKARYREFISQYVQATKKAAARQGLFFGLGALALSGGTIGWESVLASTAVGAVSVEGLNNDRFRKVADEYFAQAQIQHLLIPFATSYLVKQEQGVDLVIADQGNLAEAISGSANNPLIFKSTTLNDSDYLDPGAGRVAAVPVEDAVELFHPTKVIVLNVTDRSAFYKPNSGIIVKEIKVKEIKISLDESENAFKGVGPEFESLYELGYQTTRQALRKDSEMYQFRLHLARSVSGNELVIAS